MVSPRSALLLLLLMAPAAWASHVPDCRVSTSVPEIDTGLTPAGRLYIDFHFDQHYTLISTTWLYQESNGIEGLQRFDEWVDDTCEHPDAADHLIY